MRCNRSICTYSKSCKYLVINVKELQTKKNSSSTRFNRMELEDRTIYATGNGVKLDDFKSVLGQNIIARDLKVTEIQGHPMSAAVDKIQRNFEEVKEVDVCCEETSFGTGELATFIKQIVDTCEKNGGDLYNTWKSIAPARTDFDYTSIVAFKSSTFEALFVCVMECELCPRSCAGKIDPFAVPTQYTVRRYVNGVETVLAENVAVDNPERKSIAQQSDRRHMLHPRYYSLRAYKDWRTSA